MSWLQRAVTERADDRQPVERDGEPIPLGMDAREFVEHGAPLGEQRLTAVKVARNYWGAGYSVEDAAEALWSGLQQNNDPTREPWSFEDAQAIALDVYASDPPALRPLVKGEFAPLRRNGSTPDQPIAAHVPRSQPIKDFIASAGERKPDVVTDVVGAGANWLYGGPGDGKTVTAIEAAVTKATGRSFVGWTALPGTVLFVGVDMATTDYSQYYIDVCGDRLDEANANLRIWRPVDGLLLDEPTGATMLLEEIDAFDPELVVLDHFGLMIGGDGYSPKELNPALAVLSRIRERRALLVVDETRKESNQGNGRPPAIDQLFGGRRKASFADRAWAARRDEASGVVTLTSAKQRGSALAPIVLKMGVEGLERVDGANVSNKTPAEERVLACIAAGLPHLPRTRVDIQQATGLSQRFVKDALSKLLYLGEITHDGYRSRAKTYKCASVRKCAVDVCRGSVHSDTLPLGSAHTDGAHIAGADNRFAHTGSPALIAYGDVQPRSEVRP
jgi:hypothetical protein